MEGASYNTHTVAYVAGGSGCPRELRSRTRVQKAAQVARRMGRSLVEAREGISGHKKFRARTHYRQLHTLRYPLDSVIHLSNNLCLVDSAIHLLSNCLLDLK